MNVLHLTTDFGDLDLTSSPAALDDIIGTKEAANRPKDDATLLILRALRDEIDRRR